MVTLARQQAANGVAQGPAADGAGVPLWIIQFRWAESGKRIAEVDVVGRAGAGVAYRDVKLAGSVELAVPLPLFVIVTSGASTVSVAEP